LICDCLIQSFHSLSKLISQKNNLNFETSCNNHHVEMATTVESKQTNSSSIKESSRDHVLIKKPSIKSKLKEFLGYNNN